MSIPKRLKKLIVRLFRENCGPTTTEYAVLLVLVIFGTLSAISLLGSMVSGSFNSTTQAIPDGSSVSDSEDSEDSGKSPEPKKPPRKRRRRPRAPSR